MILCAAACEFLARTPVLLRRKLTENCAGSRLGVLLTCASACCLWRPGATGIVRDEEVAGSNPVTPTTEIAGHRLIGDLRFSFYRPRCPILGTKPDWARSAPPRLATCHWPLTRAPISPHSGKDLWSRKDLGRKACA